jgi:hypothetical protein
MWLSMRLIRYAIRYSCTPIGGFFYVLDRTNGKVLLANRFCAASIGFRHRTRRPAGVNRAAARRCCQLGRPPTPDTHLYYVIARKNAAVHQANVSRPHGDGELLGDTAVWAGAE